MNRAAEAAAPNATTIFWDALKATTFDDARKIFTGGNTAATMYFNDKTSGKLMEEFRPIVSKFIGEVGVIKQFEDLTLSAKSLDGSFHVLGVEERKIRTDPAARVTSMLNEVFGGTVK